MRTVRSMHVYTVHRLSICKFYQNEVTERKKKARKKWMTTNNSQQRSITEQPNLRSIWNANKMVLINHIERALPNRCKLSSLKKSVHDALCIACCMYVHFTCDCIGISLLITHYLTKFYWIRIRESPQTFFCVMNDSIRNVRVKNDIFFLCTSSFLCADFGEVEQSMHDKSMQP